MTRPLVLVIEDNEQNLYLARFLLEKSGFEVAEARDGPAGLEFVRTRVPAAILLDIQLPTMSGYAVATELRKNDALTGVPIIAVTSFAMVGDREHCLAAGATDYLEKPIDSAVLVAKLREHLSSRAGLPSAPPPG
ncbi:MAG TPA: response regulator [Myxococcales bacterium]|jgi:CheY-like chemotaxis protein